MKSYLEKHRKIVGILGACGATSVAIVYLMVRPEEVQATSGIQKLVLLYGHSACWFLLGTASLLWGLGKSKKLSVLLAYSALAIYVGFMAILLATKYG